uniref:Gamma A protein n=1 Tax=Poa semilatent virus TaxID=12328 RepID=A0A5B9REX3_9VIRU|nr:gamma A protein [Poa semilatent virus]
MANFSSWPSTLASGRSHAPSRRVTLKVGVAIYALSLVRRVKLGGRVVDHQRLCSYVRCREMGEYSDEESFSTRQVQAPKDAERPLRRTVISKMRSLAIAGSNAFIGNLCLSSTAKLKVLFKTNNRPLSVVVGSAILVVSLCKYRELKRKVEVHRYGLAKGRDEYSAILEENLGTDVVQSPTDAPVPLRRTEDFEKGLYRDIFSDPQIPQVMEEKLQKLLYSEGDKLRRRYHFESLTVQSRKVRVPNVGSVVDIQSWFDATFPGNSVRFSDFDGYTVSVSDLNIDVNDCKIKLGKAFRPYEFKDSLRPALRTAMPEKRQGSLAESVLALKKRNLAAPRLQGSLNEWATIKRVLEKTLDVFFFKEMIDRSDHNTYESSLRWWDKQSVSARAQILADTRGFSDIDFCTYNFMIKNDVKPKMDLTPQGEYAALQTVVYPDKIVNAFFGPIIKEVNERIIRALRPHVVFNTRMTAEQLNESVAYLTPKKYKAVEIDFSKFDKSKTGLHIKMVIALYKLFGFDGLLKTLWEKSQFQTYVKDRNYGLEAYLLFQQKSGNCDTYGSNTWSAALALLDCLPLEDAHFCIFGGDDSLILFESGYPVPDPCTKLAGTWNFECKVFDFKYPLFCGKFMLNIGGKYMFVPDAAKFIVKLGRADIRDAEVLSEIFISINDNYCSYKDYKVLEELDKALVDRYRAPYSALSALTSLCYYIFDFQKFKLLFSCDGNFVDKKLSKDFDW